LHQGAQSRYIFERKDGKQEQRLARANASEKREASQKMNISFEPDRDSAEPVYSIVHSILCSKKRELGAFFWLKFVCLQWAGQNFSIEKWQALSNRAAKLKGPSFSERKKREMPQLMVPSPSKLSCQLFAR
jgi:hypothetical protein